MLFIRTDRLRKLRTQSTLRPLKPLSVSLGPWPRPHKVHFASKLNGPETFPRADLFSSFFGGGLNLHLLFVEKYGDPLLEGLGLLKQDVFWEIPTSICMSESTFSCLCFSFLSGNRFHYWRCLLIVSRGRKSNWRSQDPKGRTSMAPSGWPALPSFAWQPGTRDEAEVRMLE